MENNNITVKGGTMGFSKLTHKMDEKEYAIAKVNIWFGMLKERQRPTKWSKPNGKGTNVDFDVVYSQEDFEAGLKDLRTYCEEVNEKYNTNFNLTTKEEEEKERGEI